MLQGSNYITAYQDPFLLLKDNKSFKACIPYEDTLTGICPIMCLNPNWSSSYHHWRYKFKDMLFPLQAFKFYSILCQWGSITLLNHNISTEQMACKKFQETVTTTKLRARNARQKEVEQKGMTNTQKRLNYWMHNLIQSRAEEMSVLHWHLNYLCHWLNKNSSGKVQDFESGNHSQWKNDEVLSKLVCDWLKSWTVNIYENCVIRIMLGVYRISPHLEQKSLSCVLCENNILIGIMMPRLRDNNSGEYEIYSIEGTGG